MRKKHRVILVAPSQILQVTTGEHLGVAYLAAGLRQNGYNVEIIDGCLEKLSPQDIANSIMRGQKPLCVGLSAYQSSMENALEIVSSLRKQGADFSLIAGGYGPTFDVETFLESGFNFVVRGEGDKTLPQLCEHLLTGNPSISDIYGVSYIGNDGSICHNPQDPLLIDLNSLPFPARDCIKLTILQNNPVNILSSKGCMGNCAFCSVQTFQHITKGPRWRQRSIMSIVDEIEDIVSIYNVSHFKFVDDSLIEPPRDALWCKQLANELEKRKLKVFLRGFIRANRVTDEIIKELKRAGFICYECGIENYAPTALKRMGKSATLQDNINALEIFKKHDVYVTTGSILFDDSTTLEELYQNYKYMRQYTWAVRKVFSEMYAAKATPFTRKLQQQNLINNENQVLGNYLYPILEPQTYKVYRALRDWSKHYAKLYEMAVTPVKSLRTLQKNELKLFHSLYMEIHEQELNVFGSILDWVASDISRSIIEERLSSHYQETKQWYEHFEKRLKEAYYSSHFNYEPIENPFL